MKKSVDWLRSLSLGNKVLVGVGVFILIAAGAGATSHPNTQPISTTKPQPQLTTTTKTITETQDIPFDSTTVNDGTLAKGTTKVTTAGVNGAKTLTYEITYKDGQQTDKKLIKTETTLRPVTQVTSVGTYVAPPPPAPVPSCPNGTYVNSAGNTVCSPYSSPSAPAGATAQCVDGTYSFSQSRSGTCSHHGGVAQWL